MGKGKKRGRDLKEDGAHARIDHEEEKKIEEDVSQETVSEKKIKKTKKMTQNSSDDQLAPQTPSRDLATSRKQDDIQNKPRNFSSNSTKLKSTNNQSNSSSPWNFIVEYNDHFETPQQAYVDLLQVLIYVAKDIGKALEDVIIYDPYYCQGRVITLLQSLGFRNIINNNRDFYRDISSNTIPEYDILVTNPPYSGEHKVKLLQYLQTIDRPYALLLPAYTATKSYWKDFIRFENQRRRNESRPGDAVIYLLPPSSYEYSHPEGTGKDLPPFYSAWFVGGSFSSLTSLRHACAAPLGPAQGAPNLPPQCSYRCLTVLTSVEALISRGYVTDSTKRPNPKQRKKMKLQKQQQRAS